MPQRLLGPMLVIVLLAADQLSKWWMLEHVFRAHLDLGDAMRFMDWLREAPERFPDISIAVTSFFNFTMVWNFGISFGLLQGKGLFLLTAIVMIILGFSIWMLRSRQTPEICALAMITGGAAGNVLDRVRFGAVADFLDFHAYGHHFPAFNVADASISIGVTFLLLHGLFFAKNNG